MNCLCLKIATLFQSVRGKKATELKIFNNLLDQRCGFESR